MSVPGSHPGAHVALSFHVSVGPSGLWQFSDFPVFFVLFCFDDLRSFEVYWLGILLNIHQFGFVQRSHYVVFWEDDHRGQCHSPHTIIKAACHQHHLPLLMWTLIACWGDFGFSICPSQGSLLSSYSPPRAQLSTLCYAQATLREWVVTLPFLEGRVST